MQINHMAGVALGVLVGTGALVASAAPELTSAWREQPVAVDGKPDEWSALIPFESSNLALGVSNDDRNLYVAVTSSDQARRRQLFMTGLIVWLDAGGGKKHAFGIRFPGQFGGGGRQGFERRPPGETRPDTASAEPPPLPGLTWFEIVGPRDDDRRRLERSAVTSIQVARDMKEGMLVYELQVPLAKAAGYGIGAEPGHVLGLGLETPAMERPEGPAPGRSGMGRRGGMGGGGGGGMGGGMGRRGGMGGGPDSAGRRGEGMARAKPLKLWTTVQLAGRRAS